MVLLQELHLSRAEELLAAMQRGRGHGLPYYGVAHVSAGSDNARGVAILVRQGGLLDEDLPASAVHRDAEGRWVRIDCNLLRQPLSILCVYAPTEGRTTFFSGLHDHVPAGGRVVMGGDFNCVCNPMLDQHPPSQTHTSRGEGAAALGWLLSQRALVDAYRHTESQGTETTHVATHSRGLFFFFPRDLHIHGALERVHGARQRQRQSRASCMGEGQDGAETHKARDGDEVLDKHSGETQGIGQGQSEGRGFETGREHTPETKGIRAARHAHA